MVIQTHTLFLKRQPYYFNSFTKYGNFLTRERAISSQFLPLPHPLITTQGMMGTPFSPITAQGMTGGCSMGEACGHNQAFRLSPFPQ